MLCTKLIKLRAFSEMLIYTLIWANLNLQTGLRSGRGLVPEKSRFSDEDDNYAPLGITRGNTAR